MKDLQVKDVHVRFRDQPKHYNLYRKFIALCEKHNRSQSVTLRMLMQRFIDEEEK